MNNLTLNAYQAEMSSTAFYSWPVIYPSMGLNGEAGEVIDKVKKLIRDGDVTFGSGSNSMTDEQRLDLAAELGDVLWYTAALAKDLGFNLNEIALMNLEKLASRKARGTLSGSGDNR